MSEPKPRVPLSSILLVWIVNLSLVVTVVVASVALRHTGTWNLEVGLQASPGAALFPDAEAAGLSHSRVTARIPAPVGLRGDLTLSLLFTAIFALYVLFDLRQLLKSVQLGRAFSRKNADRLRGMACLVIVFGVVRFVMASRVSAELVGLQYANVAFLPIQTSDLSVLTVALLLFVLGDVFARASDLQEESDLTV